jgi:hypothetical protein
MSRHKGVGTRADAKLCQHESGYSTLCSWSASDRSAAPRPGFRGTIARQAGRGAVQLRSGGGSWQGIGWQGLTGGTPRGRDRPGLRRGGSQVIACGAAGHHSVHVGGGKTEKLSIELDPPPGDVLAAAAKARSTSERMASRGGERHGGTCLRSGGPLAQWSGAFGCVWGSGGPGSSGDSGPGEGVRDEKSSQAGAGGVDAGSSPASSAHPPAGTQAV